MKTRSLTLIAATLLFSFGAVAQRGSGTFTSPRTTISSGSVGGSMSSGNSSGGSSWGTRSGSSAPSSSGGSSRSETGSGSNSWNGSSRSGSSSGSSSSGSYGTSSNNNNQPYYNNSGVGSTTGSGGSSPVYYPNDNNYTSGANDEQVRTTALKDIRNTLASLDKSNQSYRVSGTAPSTVTGLGGTMMRINPADLETVTGQPITGDIEVNLKELDGPAKMGLAGTPTMSNGEMLVSGGSYFFGMSSGGQEVKLKEGKSMEVTLPELANTEPGMELFVGEVDKNGNVNWQPVNQPLTPGYAPNPNGEMPNNGNSGSNGSNNGSTTPTRENTANMPNRSNTSNGNSNSNSAGGNRPANAYYQPINITSMGYVNADKFVRGGTRMVVEVENADPAATQVYVVFKNRRSLVEGQPERGFVSNNFIFNSIPRNEEVKVIAISSNNGKKYAGEVYTNTKDKKQFVTLTPIEEKDIEKAFEYTK